MGSPVGKNRPTWSRGGFRGVPDLKVQKLARHSNLGAPCRRHARAASSAGTPWSPHGPGDGSSIVCIALSHMQTLESIGRSHDDQLRPVRLRRTSAEAAVAAQLMTSTSLCLSRVIRSEYMITLNVVTRADDERSTGPTHCHCQCCLCETALEGRIRKIPTPTSIVRHRRMHGINNTYLVRSTDTLHRFTNTHFQVRRMSAVPRCISTRGLKRSTWQGRHSW